VCIVEGCAAKTVAKGLCPKHYMRLRKHGSTDVVEKCGPKPNPIKARLRADIAPETFSVSKFNRYWLAIKLAKQAAIEKKIDQIAKDATRPNGSFNASKFQSRVVAQALPRLRCSACGIKATIKCGCGAGYVLIKKKERQSRQNNSRLR